jgi:hypothetical protein
MTQTAHDAGLSLVSLYEALSGERSSGFATKLRVIGALGWKLRAEALAVGSTAQRESQRTPAASVADAERSTGTLGSKVGRTE